MKQNANIHNAIVNHHYQVHRRVSQLPVEEEEAGLKVSLPLVLMTVMRIVVVVVVMMVVIVIRLPHHNVSVTTRPY